MCIYLRTASVVFTPNQNLVTLEETERMRIKTDSETNTSFTDKSCVGRTHVKLPSNIHGDGKQNIVNKKVTDQIA